MPLRPCTKWQFFLPESGVATGTPASPGQLSAEAHCGSSQPTLPLHIASTPIAQVVGIAYAVHGPYLRLNSLLPVFTQVCVPSWQAPTPRVAAGPG